MSTPEAGWEARIDALERQMAELRASRGTVEAPFTVVDGEGQPLLQVALQENGRAVVSIFSPDQKPVVVLSSRPDAGSIHLSTEAGDCVVTVEGDGAAGHVTVFDQRSRPSAALFASRNAGGTLLLMNPAGKPVVGAGAMPNGSGCLIVSGEGGASVHPGVRISVNSDQAVGQVELTDSEGRPAKPKRGLRRKG